jgi:hypothetical protein
MRKERPSVVVIASIPGFVSLLEPERQNAAEAGILRRLWRWYHPNQLTGLVPGSVILKHFKSSGLLRGCYGHSEIIDIQTLGVDFFRLHFPREAPYAWGTVDDGKDDRVSCLVEKEGQVIIERRLITALVGFFNPALRRVAP